MEQNQSNGLGIGSLVCGIIGLLTGWLFGLGCILGIVAVVLSSKSKQQVGANGLATAGLILGIIAIIWGAFWLVCTICSGGLACLGATM